MEGRKLLFILVCILSIFLAGCGGGEEVVAVQEEDAISDYYTVEVISLGAEVKSHPYPLIVGREIYWTVYENEKGYACTTSRLSIDDREIVESAFSLERPFSLMNYAVDSEGGLYYLLSVKWDPAARDPGDGNKKWDTYLMKRNAEGEEVFYREVTEGVNVGYFIIDMWIDEEGRICFQGRNKEDYRLYLYDREGRYLGEEEYKYEHDREAELAYYRQTQALGKFGIQGEDVKQIVCLEDGKIVVIAGNWDTGFCELVLLAPSSVPFRAGKTELVLGALRSNPLVQDMVVDFNKSREDVYVTVREYQPSGSPRTAEDAVSALMGDILSGKGPDLIAFGLGEEMKQLAAQGVMEDLSSYVEQSSLICQEEYLPAAWELGKRNGLLYGIPMRFSIQTLAGRASLLGEREGWAVGDFMALAGTYPESLPVDPCSKSRILSICILFQSEKYLDREAGVSRFDTPEFRELMEFADAFAPDSSPASVSDDWKYRDGSVLLKEMNLSDVQSCLGIYQAFGMEPLVFTGYPAGDGAGGHLISRCNEMYGITSGSAHKQEAWEFVEHVVRRDREKESAAFPARRENLEAYLDRGLARWEAEPWLAEELKEAVFTLAGQSKAELGWGSGGGEILVEEAALYFNGRKSLDKTIKVIENRMDLLLGE